jgi:peptidoglycan biosynthesis protein MviN/MurJ (putative lipid II flippase)
MKLLSTVGVTPERPDGFGHVGVALATSSVALVNFFALTFLMRRRIFGLNGREVFAAFLKIAVAAAVMSAICYFSYYFLTNFSA